ncbi:hypothetical protein IJE86_08065 [bacterium]|nr:hypothetical protein [bacterium]
MPRMMDRRMMDGRNPYGSEGGYVTSSRRGRRRGRRDRGMDYAYDRRDYRGGDYEYDSRRGDRAYSEQDMARGRRDYESMGQSDMARGDYGDMRGRGRDYGDYEEDMARGGRGRDGHYPMSQGSTYHPVEAMGRFTGYWGEPQADYGRGRDYGYDYGYDMRGGRYDYGYDYAGDYGETLSEQELEEWKKKLMQEVEDKDRQFFTKEHIGQKAKQMGVQMKDYTEEELVVATAMVYTDYCKTAKKYIGNNMDFFIELARDWLEDKDSAVKGGEKLAIYYDCIIEGK